MAHSQQKEFCKSVKDKHPELFTNQDVLDIGSLDINGNNRYLFTDCYYVGLDVGEGKNVDIVTPGHLYDAPDESFGVVISTECFEHDMYYKQTIRNAVRMLKKGGIFLVTCAAPGRPEHGTRRTSPNDSPLTSNMGETWSDYYKNIGEQEFREVLDIEYIFKEYNIKQLNHWPFDLYFYGIKN